MTLKFLALMGRVSLAEEKWFQLHSVCFIPEFKWQIVILAMICNNQ